MAKQITAEAWSGFIGRLRQENYGGIAAELSHELRLTPEIDSVSLKAFLLKAVDGYIKEQEKKIKPYKLMVKHEIILVALGLLKGYYGDADGIEGISLTEVMEVGERRIKYLKTGPYLRIKRGTEYSSYDAIESNKAKSAAKKSLEKRDGRFIEDELAVYIANISDIENYIKQSKRDYIKNGLLKLPEQRCFLENVPAPAAPEVSPVPVALEETGSDDNRTPSPALLTPSWGDSRGGRQSYTLEEVTAGALDGHITFNCIRNSAIGDERKFIGVREDTGINTGKDNIWNIDEIKIEDITSEKQTGKMMQEMVK